MALFAACIGGLVMLRYLWRMSRGFPIFVLLASVAVLGAVFAAQYLGGLMPCELCLAERRPWEAALAIALIAALLGRRPVLPWVAGLLILVFVAGSALAFYHVGVEQHWFAGPTACTAPPGAADTVAALEAQILHQQPVRCDQPAWSLFGVSLAGWNLIASLVMLVVCLAALFRARQNPRPAVARRRPA